MAKYVVYKHVDSGQVVVCKKKDEDKTIADFIGAINVDTWERKEVEAAYVYMRFKSSINIVE